MRGQIFQRWPATETHCLFLTQQTQVCWQAGTWCAGRWNVTQPTQNSSITFVQRRSSTLVQHCTNVIQMLFTGKLFTQHNYKPRSHNHTKHSIKYIITHQRTKTQNKHICTQLYNAHPFETTRHTDRRYTACKAKRQCLLACKVSRYCLLALHGYIHHVYIIFDPQF